MEDFISENDKELNILNIIQMSIKEMSLLDIFTTDEKTFTNNAQNLIDSNGLQNKYDWPRKPEKFTNKQIVTSSSIIDSYSLSIKT